MNNISFETNQPTTANTRKFSLAYTSPKSGKVIGYVQLVPDFIKATSGQNEADITAKDIEDLYAGFLDCDLGVLRLTDNEAEESVVTPEEY